MLLLVVLGFFPKPALDVINPGVQATLQHVGVSDPQPATPASAQAEGTDR
jgi:NADH-quinone oxidoreductase subunit M